MVQKTVSVDGSEDKSTNDIPVWQHWPQFPQAYNLNMFCMRCVDFNCCFMFVFISNIHFYFTLFVVKHLGLHFCTKDMKTKQISHSETFDR